MDVYGRATTHGLGHADVNVLTSKARRPLRALVWSSLLASVATARMLAASGYVALGGSLLFRCTHAPTGCRATVQKDFEPRRMQLQR